MTGLVLEIVLGILTVLVIPMTVLRVIPTIGLLGRVMTTEGVMIGARIVGSGTVIENETGVLKSVVRLPVTSGEAKVYMKLK